MDEEKMNEELDEKEDAAIGEGDIDKDDVENNTDDTPTDDNGEAKE